VIQRKDAAESLIDLKMREAGLTTEGSYDLKEVEKLAEAPKKENTPIRTLAMAFTARTRVRGMKTGGDPLILFARKGTRSKAPACLGAAVPQRPLELKKATGDYRRSSVRTPSLFPMKAIAAMPRNRPCSTTPVTPFTRVARSSRDPVKEMG